MTTSGADLFVSIADYEDRQSAYLIDGLLAPTTNVLSGAAKACKTTLALHMVSALLHGRPLLGRSVDGRAHRVYWAGCDAGWRSEIKDAAQVMLPGSVAERLVIPPDTAEPRRFSADQWSHLAEMLPKTGFTLAVFDNLYGLMGGRSINLAHEVQPILERLQVLNEAGIAVLLLHPVFTMREYAKVVIAIENIPSLAKSCPASAPASRLRPPAKPIRQRATDPSWPSPSFRIFLVRLTTTRGPAIKHPRVKIARAEAGPLAAGPQASARPARIHARGRDRRA